MKFEIEQNEIIAFSARIKIIQFKASMHAYGAVLLQQDDEYLQLHPIEYMSRKTTSAEQKFHSYELEVFSIIAVLNKWSI